MKLKSTCMISISQLALCILIGAIVCVVGCATQSRNPLAGWTFRSLPGWGMNPNGHNNNTLDKAITDDYQSFIAQNKLSLAGAITGFFEDGTGQHAIEFDTFPPNQNASLTYVLMYSKENKRIKVVKFGYRRYQS
jgi:hypothetical protein